jgi:hypothetical protein
VTEAAKDRMADRLALRELNDAFAHGLDHNDVDFFLSIFTEDVKYRNGERRLAGRAEMEPFFRARAAAGRVSRHFWSGLRVDFISDSEARGSVNYMTFAGEGPLPVESTLPFVVSDVRDLYRKQGDGRWLIAEREIDAVFVNKAVKPLPKSYGQKP